MDRIQHALEALQINDTKVLGKARELFQQMNAKIPLGILKKGEIARPVIAVDFACRCLFIDARRSVLTGLSTLSSPEYDSAFIKCKNILQLDFSDGKNVLDSLTIHHNHPKLKEMALQVIEFYRLRNLSLMAETHQRGTDLRSPVFQAAAFKVACKLLGATFDRKKALALCLVDGSQLDRAAELLMVSALYCSNIRPTQYLTNNIQSSCSSADFANFKPTEYGLQVGGTALSSSSKKKLYSSMSDSDAVHMRRLLQKFDPDDRPPPSKPSTILADFLAGKKENTPCPENTLRDINNPSSGSCHSRILNMPGDKAEKAQLQAKEEAHLKQLEAEKNYLLWKAKKLSLRKKSP